VACGILHVTQRHAGVEGGRDEAVPQAVRTDPLVGPGPPGDAFHGPVGCVAVHALPVGTEEDRPRGPFTDVEPHGPGSPWCEWHDGALAALSGDRQDVMTPFVAEAFDVGVQRFGDSEAVERQQREQGVFSLAADPGLNHEGRQLGPVEAEGA
jgi:hypothetical protein